MFVGPGTHGSSAGAGPAGIRNGTKASVDFDATLKDARNLMNELNKAPSLPQHRQDSHGTGGLPRVTKDGHGSHDKGAAGGSYKRSKGSGGAGTSGHVPRSPHRSGSGRRSGGGGASGSHSRSTASAHAQAQAVASTASSARRPSRRSGQSQPIDAMAAAAAATPPPAPTGQQRPRSILETPIQDAARDAYYGAGEPEEPAAVSPSGRALRKPARRPSSQRLTSGQRTYSGPRPRSKGSKSGAGNGLEQAAATVE